MPRYIDAEKIEIRVPYGIDHDGEVLVPIAAVKQSIARTPTEDVAEVVHGEWIKAGVGITERIVCSACNSSKGYFGRPPFCNQCGAKMDGKRKEQS